MSTINFIDVSRHNGTVDWAKVTSPAAILKVGGSDDGTYQDANYAANAKAARAHGKHLGHYWFNGGGKPEADAAFFIDHLAEYKAEDLIVLDVETWDQGRKTYWSPAKALAWFKAVRKAKPKARLVVYMNSSLTRTEDWGSLVAYGVSLWVAQYGANEGRADGAPRIGCWKTYLVWQYTSVGTEGGIKGDVDRNLADANLWTPLPIRYTVKQGDNLSIIAAKYKPITWQAIYAANRALIGSDPDSIRVGLVLSIPRA